MSDQRERLILEMQTEGAGKVTADVDGLADATDRANRSAGRSHGNFKMAAAGVAAVATAAVAAGKALYNVGSQFDDAFDTIRVQTGKTGSALDGLQDDFRAVVKNTPTDFDAASQAIGTLNSRLGLTGTPLQRLSRHMLELSRITNTDLGSNIESTTRLFGDWSVATDHQNRTLDMLFRASQKTGVPVAKLSDMLVRYGAPLRQLGFGLENSTALVGQFEKAGVNTQLVMGSMRVALGKLAKAGKDPQEEFLKTTQAIKDAGSAGEANKLALELFGARAGPDMAAAIREGKFSVEQLAKSIANGHDTIMGASNDTRDFAEQWTIFKNRVLLKLEPIASAVFVALGVGFNKLEKGDQIIRGFFATLGKSGQVSQAVGWLREALRSIGPIVQNVVAIGTVLWNRFGDDIFRIVGNIATTMARLARDIINVLRGITTFIRGVFSGDWRMAWNGLKQIASGVWDGIKTMVSGAVHHIANVIRGAWDGVWNGLKAGGKGAINAVISLFNTGIDAINSITPGDIKVAGHTIVPGIPDIPHVPSLYTGGDITRSGWAQVGERGPELVKLPAGSTVYDAQQSAAAMNGSQPTFTVRFRDDFEGARTPEMRALAALFKRAFEIEAAHG